METNHLIKALYDSKGAPGVAGADLNHLAIGGNEVQVVRHIPGLDIETETFPDGVLATMTVRRGLRIARPVRLCFGIPYETGRQHIDMKIRLEEGARLAVLADCRFPNAVKVLHAVDTQIEIGKDAEFICLERHRHGGEGGVTIRGRTRIQVGRGARCRSDLELVESRTGRIDVEYDAECLTRSALDMTARISGQRDDEIRIYQKAHLKGDAARGALKTQIAVRDRALADINSTMIASAPFARGHVVCRQFVRDRAIASAVPIIEVQHPKAHVTHEASIGRVDAKQLETLMCRGLTEDEATDLIIEGLLRANPADGGSKQ